MGQLATSKREEKNTICPSILGLRRRTSLIHPVTSLVLMWPESALVLIVGKGGLDR